MQSHVNEALTLAGMGAAKWKAGRERLDDRRSVCGSTEDDNKMKKKFPRKSALKICSIRCNDNWRRKRRKKKFKD
jgi:hypothetical protein